MRVLVVDQDSAATSAIARSLGDRYTVDAVSSKAHAMDLLRANAFEVVVAGERLEDGSGLELLSQVARKWPTTLRIFVADRHRLTLLKGKLGPFRLFRTLAYPMDPERLADILTLAEGTQDAHPDTSNLQHVAPAPAVEGEPADDPDASEEFSEAEEPRVASQGSVGQARRPKPSLHSLSSHRGRHSAGGPSVGGGRPPGSAPSRVHEHGRAPRHTRGRDRSGRFSPGDPAIREAATGSYMGGGTLRQPATRASTSEQATALPRSVDITATAGPSRNEIESTRTLYVIGGVITATLAAIIVGVRMWGSGEATTPTVARVVTGSPAAAPASSQAPADSHSPVAAAEPHKSVHQPTSRAASRHAASVAQKAAAPAEKADATTTQTAHDTASGSPTATGDPAAGGTPEAAKTGTAVAPSPSTATAAAGTLVAAAAQPASATNTDAQTAHDTPVIPTTAPRRTNSDEPPPVVREAKLIRHVPAVYPAAARRDGIVGSVDLEVIVSQQGAVKDVLVTRAEPTGVFEKAALAAVHKWRYDPQYVDGLPVDAHVKVHLDFRPD